MSFDQEHEIASTGQSFCGNDDDLSAISFLPHHELPRSFSGDEDKGCQDRQEERDDEVSSLSCEANSSQNSQERVPENEEALKEQCRGLEQTLQDLRQERENDRASFLKAIQRLKDQRETLQRRNSEIQEECGELQEKLMGLQKERQETITTEIGERDTRRYFRRVQSESFLADLT